MKNVLFLFSVIMAVPSARAMWGSAIEYKKEIPFLSRTTDRSKHKLARYFPEEKEIEEEKKEDNFASEHSGENTNAENNKQPKPDVELVLGYEFVLRNDEKASQCFEKQTDESEAIVVYEESFDDKWVKRINKIAGQILPLEEEEEFQLSKKNQ